MFCPNFWYCCCPATVLLPLLLQDHLRELPEEAQALAQAALAPAQVCQDQVDSGVHLCLPRWNLTLTGNAAVLAVSVKHGLERSRGTYEQLAANIRLVKGWLCYSCRQQVLHSTDELS